MPPFFTPYAGPVQPDQFDVFAHHHADDDGFAQFAAS